MVYKCSLAQWRVLPALWVLQCEGKGENDRYKSRRWYCRDCNQNFTAKTHTILYDSKLGFQKWVISIYLFVKNLKGISSMQLHRELDMTQKVAWHVGHRLRHAMYHVSEKFEGPVEVDESYFGGKNSNRHWNKKRNVGRGVADKDILVGLVDRKTKVAAIVFTEDTKKQILQKIIVDHVEPGAKVFTDEHKSYIGLEDSFEHKSIKHRSKQYAREDNGDNVNTVPIRFTHTITRGRLLCVKCAGQSILHIVCVCINRIGTVHETSSPYRSRCFVLIGYTPIPARFIEAQSDSMLFVLNHAYPVNADTHYM